MSDRVFALALGDGRLTPAMTKDEVDAAVLELVKKAVTAVYIVAQDEDEFGHVKSVAYEKLAQVEVKAGVDWGKAYEAAKAWAEDSSRKIAVAVPEIKIIQAPEQPRKRRRRSKQASPDAE